MTYIFITLLAICLIALVLWVFVNSEPSSIALAVKIFIPVVLSVFGFIATITGQGQFGIPALGLALFIWYRMYRRR